MNGDLKTYCAALIKRFVGMQYDGLSGRPVKPAPVATERGAKALRRSIDKMRAINIRKKRNLRHSDFQILQINAPEAPGDSIDVTAIESFRLEYDSTGGDEDIVSGRRGHTFRLVLGPEGNLVVDDHDSEVLDERRENPSVVQRAARTVLMKRRQPAAEAVPAAYRNAAHSQELARALRRARLRKAGVLVIFFSWVGCVCVWLYGAHSRIDRIDLYTGLHRDTLVVMDRQLWDRSRPNDVSAWVGSLGLPAPSVPDGHYWAVFGGWEKQLLQPRAILQPDNNERLAFDASQTLQVIYLKSQQNGAEAAAAYTRYRMLIDELVKLREDQSAHSDLASIKDGLRQMRLALTGLE